MLFSSPEFLFWFLPLVLVSTALIERAFKNALLLLWSLVFYSWGEGGYAVLMLGSIGVNYGVGLAISGGSTDRIRRTWVGVGVAANVLLLVAFKYLGFLTGAVNDVLGAVGAGSIEMGAVHLPIGISFFTFQALSYLVDVYRDEAPARRNPVDFALYIALFPQLIAGPIVRYRQIADQLRERTVTLDGFAWGVRRFVIGLAKKMLIADTVAECADAIFLVPDAGLTASLAWLGVACYAVQIYFDFSGYSDMAIGLGRMLGFTFPENFRYPYVSQSVTEFWRRWHITLSSWFRDYLFIPLGGHAKGRIRGQVNLFFVFVLCGLWHGAAWPFVLFGAYHGLFLVLERTAFGALVERAPRPLRHGYLMLVVLVGWVLFRCETLGAAITWLRAMAGFGAGDGLAWHARLYWNAEIGLAFAAGAVGSLPWLPSLARRLGVTEDGSTPITWGAVGARAAALLVLAAVFFLSAAEIAGGTNSPFIYFRF